MRQPPCQRHGELIAAAGWVAQPQHAVLVLDKLRLKRLVRNRVDGHVAPLEAGGVR